MTTIVFCMFWVGITCLFFSIWTNELSSQLWKSGWFLIVLSILISTGDVINKKQRSK